MINEFRVRYNFFYPTSCFDKIAKFDTSFMKIWGTTNGRRQGSAEWSHLHQLGILKFNSLLIKQ